MSLLRKIKMGFGFIGIDLYKMIFTLRGIPSFIIDYINSKKNGVNCRLYFKYKKIEGGDKLVCL